MKRTTIVDVGRRAGVSTKTVSRVFNDEPHVSEDVRERVRAAAAELDYHPNVLAQALVRRRSHMIGLIYENPSPNYVVELQEGVLDRLHDGRYRMIVLPVQSAEEKASEIVGLVRSAALDGVVLAPPVCDHPLVLSQLTAAGIAFTRISPTRLLDEGGITLIDDVAAAREIATHLLNLGHREIGIILGDPTHPSCDQRLVGYRQAFATAGVAMRDDLIGCGLYTYDSGVAAARALLDRPSRPTAILAQNDDMAVGALTAARELGLSLPGDLSVVGFDGSGIGRISWPKVTTIRQPVFEMARSAADMVVGMLEASGGSRRIEHRHELLIRESTAPVPPPLRSKAVDRSVQER